MRLRFFIDTANSDLLALRVAWPHRLRDGRSLLTHAVEKARRLADAKDVVVIGGGADAAGEAKRLGVASSPTATTDGADVCFTLSVRAPMLADELLLALAQAAHAKGSAIVVTDFKGSPNGAFVPVDGVMDFRHTLDGPRWRELENARWFHCPSIASAASKSQSSATSLRPALVIVDELSAFRIDSDADLWIANRLLTNHSHVNAKGPWRTL